MFTNKSKDGTNNLCGQQVHRYRKSMKLSQRELAEKLQIAGLDVDKNAIQRIECGKRFVTDIELVVLSGVLKCGLEELLLGSPANTSVSTSINSSPNTSVTPKIGENQP